MRVIPYRFSREYTEYQNQLQRLKGLPKCVREDVAMLHGEANEIVEAEVRARRFLARFGSDVIGEYFHCSCWLLGTEHSGFTEDCFPPYHDHDRSFITTSGRMLTTQPYTMETNRIQEASDAFAEKYSLSVRVSWEDSWYRPGKTVLVEYRKM